MLHLYTIMETDHGALLTSPQSSWQPEKAAMFLDEIHMRSLTVIFRSVSEPTHWFLPENPVCFHAVLPEAKKIKAITFRFSSSSLVHSFLQINILFNDILHRS